MYTKTLELKGKYDYLYMVVYICMKIDVCKFYKKKTNPSSKDN